MRNPFGRLPEALAVFPIAIATALTWSIAEYLYTTTENGRGNPRARASVLSLECRPLCSGFFLSSRGFIFNWFWLNQCGEKLRLQSIERAWSWWRLMLMTGLLQSMWFKFIVATSGARNDVESCRVFQRSLKLFAYLNVWPEIVLCFWRRTSVKIALWTLYAFDVLFCLFTVSECNFKCLKCISQVSITLMCPCGLLFCCKKSFISNVFRTMIWWIRFHSLPVLFSSVVGTLNTVQCTWDIGLHAGLEAFWFS